jgi:hypothetical protein
MFGTRGAIPASAHALISGALKYPRSASALSVFLPMASRAYAPTVPSSSATSSSSDRWPELDEFRPPKSERICSLRPQLNSSSR